MSSVVGDKVVVGRERVGQEDSVVNRIRRAWIDGIGGEGDYDDDERVNPCVPKREGFPSPQDRLGFPSFGKWAGLFRLRAPLKERVSRSMGMPL